MNSTGADKPRGHARKKWPVEGWVELNLRTMRKSPATTRVLKRTARYAVFNVRGDDVLNVRSGPGRNFIIVGAIPHDAKGIQITGAGEMGPGGKSGLERWAPIRFQAIVGWVNQRYLREESESFDRQQTRSK